MRSFILCLFFVAWSLVVAHPSLKLDGSTPKTVDELKQLGKAVVPPKPVYHPNPDFPEKLRKKKKTGTVVISFVVDEHGIPRQLEIKHTSDHGFDRVALDAVKQWRFEPATVDGEPTPVITDAEISFRLY